MVQAKKKAKRAPRGRAPGAGAGAEPIFGKRAGLGSFHILAGHTSEFVRTAADEPVAWVQNSKPELWGQTALLCGRGYSATRGRVEAFKRAGVFTAWMNNYPRAWFDGGLLPDCWITTDPSKYFCRFMWEAPEVLKFAASWSALMAIPRADADQPIRYVYQCPNVHYYDAVCNDGLRYFLQTPYVCWGTSRADQQDNQVKRGGVRSVMFAALRILWHLGFRRVYLLGCDFTPTDHPAPYYYADLADLLALVKPQFDRYGYSVVNLNPDSHLRVFDYLPFEQGLAEAGRAA